METGPHGNQRDSEWIRPTFIMFIMSGLGLGMLEGMPVGAAARLAVRAAAATTGLAGLMSSSSISSMTGPADVTSGLRTLGSDEDALSGVGLAAGASALKLVSVLGLDSTVSSRLLVCSVTSSICSVTSSISGPDVSA